MLREKSYSMTLGHQAERVVKVLIQMPQFASYASAREVAERAGANVSTVVRTAQQLGFEGWTDLRSELRSLYLTSLVEPDGNEINAAELPSAMLKQDAVNLSALTTAENANAIHRIARTMLSARRTVILATGSGAGPAQILYYLSSIYGLDIRLATGPPTTQAVDVSQLDERDCLIVLNVWRLTRALRQLASLGQSNGATVAVFTDLRSSPLCESADHVVVTPMESIGATPSLTALVAAIQALLSELEKAAPQATVRAIERSWETLGLMDDQV